MPVAFNSKQYGLDTVNTKALAELVQAGLLQQGDLVLITCGDHLGVQGGTNQMKIMHVD